MKVPLSWIKQYIAIDLPPNQIAKLLTMAGLEVEGCHSLGGSFTNVVVCRVVEVKKHPDADKLVVATVSDGEQLYQVVCGASNCRAGIKTALAKIGATLQNNGITVRKSKLRGVESYGMLCSSQELGLSDQHEGIIEFEEFVQEGKDVADMYGDVVFDIALTPNLSHCTSVLGVARELSAVTGLPFTPPKINVRETGEPIGKTVAVSIEGKEACPIYSCRLIRGVKVAPSPDWLQKQLSACGIRSVNNVVDATNYVMHELGHPLHAFDADLLEENRIVVRFARDKEEIVTLDSKKRVLQTDDLVIADGKKAVAMAGMMGGLNSEVGDNTQNVLIESAYFTPLGVRKTSKRLGIQTDGSKRFGTGADPNQTVISLDRVTELIQQLAGGEIAKGAIVVQQQEFKEKQVGCRLSRLNALIGMHFGLHEVETIFKQLGFTCHWDGKDHFSLKIPTYRVDIQEEIDLIEEVARIYGYDKIVKQKRPYNRSKLEDAPIYRFEQEMRARLIAEGLQEFITCDLISPTMVSLLKDSLMQADATLKVLNPTSIEQSILRTSLLPGLLNVVKSNYLQQNHDVAGFEIGRIHFKEGAQYKEQVMAGVILSGKSDPYHFESKAREADFFDLKGIIENICKSFLVPNPTFQLQQLSAFHPGRQASIFVDGVDVGTIGEIHPSILRVLDIPQRIFFAEFSLNDLFHKRKTDIQMTEIPRYPGSSRDLTLTLEKQKPIQQIFDAVNKLKSPLLVKASLIDIYRSEKLGENHQNATFRFEYRDNSKTLSQQEVDKEHERIVKTLG